MAKRESTQKKLSRVRPPRVHITYDVQIGDAIEKKDLPFVVGVLGDFSGQPTEQRNALFDVGDFKDSARLAVKLRDGKDPLSQHLRTQFSPDMQQRLNSYDGSSPLPKSLQKSLISELNRLIKGPSLFEEQRFAQVKLTEGTRRLIAQNPQGEHLMRLNLLLLIEAYPNEIAKSQQKRFKERSLIEIDRDNFDEVLAGMRPRLAYRVENTLEGDGTKLNIELTFDSLADFEPDQVVQQIEPLNELIEARRRLSDLLSRMDGNDRLEELLRDVIQNTGQQQQLSQALGLGTPPGAGEDEARKEKQTDEQ